MTVILLLLKIIGILLLTLLGILLLLISLVLFVPVRYQIGGELGDEKTIRGRVLWLFRFVNWSFVYEKENFQARKIRICGIPLNFKKKKKAVDEDAETDAANEFEESTKVSAANEFEGRAETDAANEFEESTEMDGGSEFEQGAEIDIEDKTKEGGKSNIGDGVKEKKASDVADKAEKGVFRRIRSFFSNIRDSFGKARNTLCHIKVNVSDIKKQITDETNRKAVLYVLSELKYMLQHFGFRKIDTNLTFSLGDPATTGQILGILCMLPFLYRYSVRIYPDFETDEAYVRGNYLLAGRIRPVHVLVSLIRLLKKQEVRILLNRVMKK